MQGVGTPCVILEMENLKKMKNQIQKQLIYALRATVAELEYALHNQGSIWMTDYNERQALIDKNPVITQAREAIKEALK